MPKMVTDGSAGTGPSDETFDEPLDQHGGRQGVEITIGVQHMTRELLVETDQTAAAVVKAVSKALETGNPLELTDTRGRRIIVPASNLGYIEIGDEPRKVGLHNL